MAIRKIVNIDESKCNGCGLCIPNCVEGALKIIDGKAKLVSDVYCDGLGACLGHCPQDAITVIEREADEFDEKAVEEFLASEKQNKGSENLAGHNHEEGCKGGRHHGHTHMHHGGCPGSMMRQFESKEENNREVKVSSKLRQWPVQLTLVSPNAPYFNGADLLITADCVPFAYGNYHNEFLDGRAVVVGCPKLDDVEFYTNKLEEIIRANNLKSITVLRMEVPCCGGIMRAAQMARDSADAELPISVITIGIQGEIKRRELI